MATQVQNRRGTTAEHSTFTGANGELTVDTTKRTLVVHDGATAGGRPLLREDQSNLPTSAPTTGIYNASGSLAISTGGSGRLFVDASGNVGLNVNPPTAYANYSTLSINGSSGSLISFRSAGTIVGEVFSTSSALKIGTNTGQPLVFETNGGTERLRITSTGTVNIKGAGTAGSTQAVSFNGSAPVDSLVIDSSGRLLVGTSSVRASFQRPNINVEGLSDGGITICRNNADASGPVLEFGKTRSTSIGGVAAVTSGDFLGLIRFYGANGSTLDNEAARISAEVDGAVSGGGANDMPGRLVFSTTSDGQANPTPRLTITSTGQVRLAGAGITFNGDTATANELDDYEEGSWTPSISGLTGFDTPSGTYTKIGRMVYCSFWVNGTFNAAYTITDPIITSLPFTAGASQAIAGSAVVLRLDSQALIAGPTAIAGNGDVRMVISNSGTNNPSRGFGGQFAYRV